MAWIEDEDMRTQFLAHLNRKLIDTCNDALTVSRKILKALPEEPLSTDLAKYLKDMLPHLEQVRTYPAFPTIRKAAARACEIIRAACNFWLISFIDKPFAELKTLKSLLNDAFILTSSLTSSPLAEGKELIKEWTQYFPPNFMTDTDFTSSLLQANSKLFRKALDLSMRPKRKRVRPAKSKDRPAARKESKHVGEGLLEESGEFDKDGMPGVVQATIDSLLVGQEEHGNAGTSSASSAHANDVLAGMSFPSVCRSCAHTANGTLDEQGDFYCNACWSLHLYLEFGANQWGML